MIYNGRICFLVLVDDYHTISLIAESIVNQKLDSFEIGFVEKKGHYLGVIYEGERPSLEEIILLLVNNGLDKFSKD